MRGGERWRQVGGVVVDAAFVVLWDSALVGCGLWMGWEGCVWKRRREEKKSYYYCILLQMVE